MFPVTNVQDAEVYFGIDEYDDLARTHKPIIYITPLEVFSMHRMLNDHLEMLAPQQNDLLQQILQDLGEIPPIEEETNNTSNTSELSLTLVNRFAEETINSPATELNHLFMETKRYVLSIIRVQTGQSLLDILVQPVTQHDEEVYSELIKADKHDKNTKRQRPAPSDASAAYLVDVTTITFAELKKFALQNILHLEKLGKVSRQNNYQDILNAIAIDIRNKHRRRMHRQKEMQQIRQTLMHLDEKRAYLDDQIKSYNDYIDACLQQLTTKKGYVFCLYHLAVQYLCEVSIDANHLTDFFYYKQQEAYCAAFYTTVLPHS
jgi:Ras GTPase-activating-like protein IQGAP2/3